MARTRNSPALYELISDKHRPVRVYATKPAPMPPPHDEAAVPVEVEPIAPEPEVVRPEPVREPEVARVPEPRYEPVAAAEETALPPAPETALSADKVLGLITPGRSIRIPIGYVFLGLALLIGLVAIIWSVASSQAERKTKEQIGRDLAGGETTISEPLNQTAPLNKELLKGSTPKANQRVAIDDPTGPAPVAGSSPARNDRQATKPAVAGSADVVFVDDPATDEPREPGMNYYVVASLPKAEAERAAAFLADQGVPAARLAPGPNKLCQVIALRAFAPKTLGTTEALQFKAQIQKIGREYKRDHKGPTDFSDMYPDKYKGKGRTR